MTTETHEIVPPHAWEQMKVGFKELAKTYGLTLHVSDDWSDTMAMHERYFHWVEEQNKAPSE